ncbi:MAG: type 4a pilus biogenesis protein PilO [Thermoclostridium sp.]|nr:type 4a pilus biogenesis protein PilO [Thermoclostridium sp.]
MKKKNNLQVLLMIAFMLVTVVFGYLIVREGLLIRKQSAEIYRIEAIIEEQQVLLKKMRDAEARSSEYETKLLQLQKMIPDQPEQNQFVVWVQQASADASLKLTDISFNEHTVEEGYSVMPVQLSLYGNYVSTLKFLSDMLYGERLVRVDDVDLSGSGVGLNISMKINLFYKDSTEAAAKKAEN